MQRLITISFILLHFSCAGRKMHRYDEQSKMSKTDQLESVDIIKKEQITHIDTNIDIATINDEFIIKPIDNSRPMTIEGKIFINATITTKKSQSQKKEVIKKQETQNSQAASCTKQQSETKLSTATKIKDTERCISYWFWLILIPVIVFGYRIYKKY